MNLYRKLSDVPDTIRGGALTVGNFDGVHRGHSQIIERLRYHARMVGGSAIVFTFDPHPVRLLRPEQTPPPLTWTNRKAELLSEMGVDAIIAYPTDEDFLELSSQQFFDRVIVEALEAKAIVEGPNFYFGRNREGDVEMLEWLSDSANIDFEIVEPIQDGNEFISSSRIRNLISEGNVGEARKMLTRPYRIRGTVTHGAARGAKIGFPTANLAAIDTLVPANGVYAGKTNISGRTHLAAINIGTNPTFGDPTKKVEVHVLNFGESIYGATIEVDFIERLRDIRQFDSPEELITQLEKDIAATRQFANC